MDEIIMTSVAVKNLEKFARGKINRIKRPYIVNLVKAVIKIIRGNIITNEDILEVLEALSNVHLHRCSDLELVFCYKLLEMFFYLKYKSSTKVEFKINLNKPQKDDLQYPTDEPFSKNTKTKNSFETLNTAVSHGSVQTKWNKLIEKYLKFITKGTLQTNDTKTTKNENKQLTKHRWFGRRINSNGTPESSKAHNLRPRFLKRKSIATSSEREELNKTQTTAASVHAPVKPQNTQTDTPPKNLTAQANTPPAAINPAPQAETTKPNINPPSPPHIQNSEAAPNKDTSSSAPEKAALKEKPAPNQKPNAGSLDLPEGATIPKTTKTSAKKRISRRYDFFILKIENEFLKETLPITSENYYCYKVSSTGTGLILFPNPQKLINQNRINDTEKFKFVKNYFESLADNINIGHETTAKINTNVVSAQEKQKLLKNKFDTKSDFIKKLTENINELQLANI